MKFNKTLTPISVKEQYDEFCGNRWVKDACVEKFIGPDGRDCYNPSMPFTLNGKEYMVCRTQKRDGIYSTVYFFEKDGNGVWRVVEGAPTFEMEDPSIAIIQGKIVLSGIVATIADGKTVFVTSWYTKFYIINSLTDIEFLTDGPANMKDIKLVELADGKVGIFSRPNGYDVKEATGYLAKIGFTTVDKLSDLNADVIEKAEYLNNFFLPDEWGGCNYAYLLKNGLIGVISHKSYRIEEDLHYYGTFFVFNPKTREFTDMKVIISRDCFPYCEPREKRLTDIVFASGIIRNGDGTAKIYTGLSDSAIGSAIIKDPFIDYEN